MHVHTQGSSLTVNTVQSSYFTQPQPHSHPQSQPMPSTLNRASKIASVDLPSNKTLTPSIHDTNTISATVHKQNPGIEVQMDRLHSLVSTISATTVQKRNPGIDVQMDRFHSLVKHLHKKHSGDDEIDNAPIVIAATAAKSRGGTKVTVATNNKNNNNDEIDENDNNNDNNADVREMNFEIDNDTFGTDGTFKACLAAAGTVCRGEFYICYIKIGVFLYVFVCVFSLV